MTIDRKVNLSDFMHKAILQQEFAQAEGWHEFKVRPVRVKATQEQFAYYYAVILPIAAQWLNQTQGGAEDRDGVIHDFDADAADVWLKLELRGREVVNPKTGELMGKVPPLKRHWDVLTMVRFVDDVIGLLKDGGCRNIPPPDKEWKAARAKAMQAA